MSATKDDSMPSSVQLKRQQHATQTQRLPSHSSDSDDDIVETLDDQPSSAIYEVHGL